MKLGLFKPEAIAAGIVWFVIIVLVSPFFGYEYIWQDDYVTIQQYEELQGEVDYWQEEYENAVMNWEYCENILIEHGIDY